MTAIASTQAAAGPARRRQAPARRKTRSGLATVECAAILPVLALLITGMLEISRGISVVEVLDDAARKACRIGALPGSTNDQVTSAVNDIMADNSLPNLTLGQSPGITISVIDQKTGVAKSPTSNDVSKAVKGDLITLKIGVQVSDALYYWPNTYFLGSSAIESQQMTIMKQGGKGN